MQLSAQDTLELIPKGLDRAPEPLLTLRNQRINKKIIWVFYSHAEECMLGSTWQQFKSLFCGWDDLGPHPTRQIHVANSHL
jgi:hypothetical protein